MSVDFYLNRSHPVGPNMYHYDIVSRSTRSSTKSPRYFGHLAKVENVIDRSWTKTQGTPCYWAVKGQGASFSQYLIGGGYESVPEPNLTKVSELEIRAFEEARDRAYGHLSNVQMKLWEYYAERRKIAATLLQKAMLLREVVTAIRAKTLLPIEDLVRRKYYDRRKREWVIEEKRVMINRNFSDLWLEYSFMWAPLMEDIKTLYNDIDPIEGVFVTGVGRVNDTIVSHTPIDAGKSRQDNYRTDRIQVRCKVKLFVTIDDPLQAMLHEVGILNLSAPWDVAPYSFVVDWFFKVGSFLERICTPGKTVTDGSTTYLTQVTSHTWASKSGEYDRTADDKVSYYTTIGSGVKVEKVLYRRNLGIPSPWYITTSRPDELWHAITSWALISQILHSGFIPKKGRDFRGY